jgi:hypothetical protein
MRRAWAWSVGALGAGLLLAGVTGVREAAAAEAAFAEPATAERSADALPVIAPENGLEHLDEKCSVEFVVKGGTLLKDKQICFINSLKDHRDKANFTAVIFREGLARFAVDEIDDPATHFMGKTIRVSGRVAEHRGQAQIVVESPSQIEVLDAAAEEDAVGDDADEDSGFRQ